MPALQYALGKQSIFYTWNASLGLNYLALISYYLGGIFTPLVLFFPNQLDARCVLLDLDQDRQCGFGVLVLCQPNL